MFQGFDATPVSFRSIVPGRDGLPVVGKWRLFSTMNITVCGNST
jgi:hypothetical protein